MGETHFSITQLVKEDAELLITLKEGRWRPATLLTHSFPIHPFL